MSEISTTPAPKSKVLVADDEQVIANTLAIILNQAGFEARAVYSGEKAIEALDSFEPDMLISDVIMPGMTGIEAAIITPPENAEVQDPSLLRPGGNSRSPGKSQGRRPRVRNSRETGPPNRSPREASRLI